MKQEISKPTEIETEDDEMRPEYDFSKMAGGVRGKHYQAYRAGHTIKIHRIDGTTTISVNLSDKKRNGHSCSKKVKEVR